MRGFILALLLAAIIGQPSLAVPVACTMPVQQKAMSCSSCCQHHCCCAANAANKAQRLAALSQTVAQDQIGYPSAGFSAARAEDLPPRNRAGAVLLGSGSHGPPPLTVSCIRLI